MSGWQVGSRNLSRLARSLVWHLDSAGMHMQLIPTGCIFSYESFCATQAPTRRTPSASAGHPR
jgi:hypothetical protein